MMDYPRFIILDIGHGNCSVLVDSDQTAVFDAPNGSTLLDFLEMENIKVVDKVILSHADSDHIGGVVNLLSDKGLQINKIYLNPDSKKDTEVWTALRLAIKDVKSRGTEVIIGIYKESSIEIRLKNVEIQILAPSAENLLSGPGGIDLAKRTLDSNAMSIVIGLVHKDHRVAILCGDINNIGLENLLSNNEDISADLLLYPHHGGNPGNLRNLRAFAKKISESVKSKLIVFSIGRNHYRNPNPDVIKGVLEGNPTTYIMCTQLSQNCSEDSLKKTCEISKDLPSKGLAFGHCCAGTIEIKMDGKNTNLAHIIGMHKKFVASTIKGAICQN